MALATACALGAALTGTATAGGGCATTVLPGATVQHATTQLDRLGASVRVWLIPGDDLARDAALDQLFDVGQEAVFIDADQRDGTAIGACTTGAADAVHVVFGHIGQLVVHHVGQHVDVDATRGDVRGHQHLGAAVPVIEAAVAARNISAVLAQRRAGQALYGPAPHRLGANAPTRQVLEQALIAGKILCYAQGFVMLARATEEFGWSLPLPEIARVWRAGCIIRSAMLNDMATALAEDPGRNLMLAPFFADHLSRAIPCLRQLVALSALNGLPVPALSAGLAWFDQMRTARSTANLIQGQRDFFGAHGFDRIDGAKGSHGPWAQD